MDSENNTTTLNLEKSVAFNARLLRLDPLLKWDVDAKRSIGLRPEETWIRDELQRTKVVALAGRRASMKRLYVQEAAQFQAELATRGLGMMPTQP